MVTVLTDVGHAKGLLEKQLADPFIDFFCFCFCLMKFIFPFVGLVHS